MAVFTAIVDDQDPSIQYQGNWFREGVSEEFMGTTSRPDTTDAFATFSFTGTGIGVYGTINGDNGTAQFSFILDGAPQDIGSLAPAPNHLNTRHQPFFLSPQIPDGRHQLIINRVGGTSPGLWLDYLLYNTSSSTDTHNVTYFIDDTSPLIQYDTHWTRAALTSATDTGLGAPLQSTATSIKPEGGGFTLPFSGSAISIYGKIPNTNVTSTSTTTAASISIDQTKLPNISVPPNPPAGPIANTLLFSATSMKDEDHNLTLQVSPGNIFTLDYILVKPIPTTPTTNSTGSPSGPNPGSSSNPPATANTSSKSQVGTIAGSVVGGVVLIALIAVLLLLYRRRRRKPENVRSSEPVLGYPDHVQQPSAPNMNQYGSQYASSVHPSQASQSGLMPNRYPSTPGLSDGLPRNYGVSPSSHSLPPSGPVTPPQVTPQHPDMYQQNRLTLVGDAASISTATSSGQRRIGHALMGDGNRKGEPRHQDSRLRFPRDDDGTTVPPPQYTDY